MHQKKQIKFPQAKHYYAKCNHPEDRGEVYVKSTGLSCRLCYKK